MFLDELFGTNVEETYIYKNIYFSRDKITNKIAFL